MRLELLTKAQKLELFNQMQRHLLMYADSSYKYKECFTLHKIETRWQETIFVELEWFYFDMDVYVTSLKCVTKDVYEKACSNNN